MGWFHHLLPWVRNLPPEWQYLFIFLWLFLESLGGPFADEPLLIFAGVQSLSHRLELIPVILVALAGRVLAGMLAYWLGTHVPIMKFARPTIQPTAPLGRLLWYVQPTEIQLVALEERVQKSGELAVFIGMFIPIVRSFISYAAGAGRLRFDKFLLGMTGGSLIWISSWALLGFILGKSAHALSRPIQIGLCAVAAVGIGGLLYWNHRRAEREAQRLYEERREREQRQKEQEEAAQKTQKKQAKVGATANHGTNPNGSKKKPRRR